MSLAEGILQIMEEQARAHGFVRVIGVRLEIGALSHVEPEALEFCFAAVTKETLAEGAQVEIMRTPGQAWCMACAQTVSVSARYDPCPYCGGYALQITAGDEMRVKELEIE